jgi:hypothetical protein
LLHQANVYDSLITKAYKKKSLNYDAYFLFENSGRARKVVFKDH